MLELQELDYDKCDELLRAGVFAWVALSRPTAPETVPVNYAVVDQAVLVRTAAGSLLDRFADGAALVFEVDDVNYEYGPGWSVVARGRGERIFPRRPATQGFVHPGGPAGSSGTARPGSGCRGSR